jgi:tetratricopeptide (TPR) repeat protein
MRKKNSRRTYWMIAALVAGILFTGFGVHLATYTSTQTQYYNLGLAAYEQENLQLANAAFDRSIQAYKQESRAGWMHRFLYPEPSREMAALAYFHKAKVLLRARQVEPAVEAFKESLRLNAGNGYKGIPLSDAQRLEAQAEVVKYDLELLFKNQPQQGKGQGKGKGKPQPGDGKGNQQVPGDQPGSQPGKGKPDDI